MYQIASDLIGNVMKIQDGNIVFIAIEIYLICLDKFKKIKTRPSQQKHKNKENDYWKKYKCIREKIVHWLENDLFNNQELMVRYQN